MILLLACSNTMSTTGTAPFSLGRVSSALFIGDPSSAERADYGRATLVLSGDRLACHDIQEASWADADGSPVEEGDHLVATVYWSYNPFDWEDYQEGDGRAGWQGMYGSGVTVSERAREGVVYRRFWLEAFDEGTRWDLDAELGLLEIESSDDVMEGTLDHQSVEARFAARNCGTQEAAWDTGYGYR